MCAQWGGLGVLEMGWTQFGRAVNWFALKNKQEWGGIGVGNFFNFFFFINFFFF